MANLTRQLPYQKTLPHIKKEDKEYRAWLRTLPCCICAKPPPNEACHVRFNEDGTDAPATGYKPYLKAVPMDFGCHKLQHNESHTIYGNKDFWLTLAKHYLQMFRTLKENRL